MPIIPHPRSGKSKTAIIASIVLVAALGAIAYQFLGKSSSPPPDNGVSIAEPFLASVRSGQVDAAWDSTSAEFKSLQGKEEFKKYVKEHPVLKEPLGLETFQNVTLSKKTCLQCNFHKEAAPGAKPKVRVFIAQDVGGAWKVERLLVD